VEREGSATLRAVSPNPSQIDYSSNIKDLEAKLAEHDVEGQRLRAELDWYRKGLELFGAQNGRGPESRPSSTTELVPTAEVFHSGGKPRLRQAVLMVMGERQPAGGEEHAWRARDILVALAHRGWAPNGSHADHVVRKMLADLAERGQLIKTGRGEYRLSASARAGEMGTPLHEPNLNRTAVQRVSGDGTGLPPT